MAHGIAAYSKGEVFLAQLAHVIGEENLEKTIKKYYSDFKFTHPTPNDIKRTAEKITGANLDWYLNEWAQTTNTIDYAIKEVQSNETQTKVIIERKGRMPMPIDIIVEYTDGSKEFFYIPNTLMRWEKPNPYPNLKRTVLPSWDWAYPTFSFQINKQKSEIKAIDCNPNGLLADVKPDDNKVTLN